VHKLLYIVLIASKKLCHYFQAHRISVVTSYPLKTVLHNPNATRNIAKWAVELAEFEMDFLPRHAVKSQVLAGFMVDWTPPLCHPGGSVIASRRSKLWSSPSLTGHSSSMVLTQAGVLLLTPVGEQFKYMVHLDFKATNNVAEYKALIFGLSTTLSLRVWQLLVNGDY
jgi:hypothetical protein